MGPVYVLLVEDELLIRMCMVSLLEQLGCVVVGETSYGEEAVQLTKQVSPDIILMDIRLKGDMDGIEAAKQISMQSSTPILFMSAYDYGSRISREKIPNTLGYISKPVEISALEFYLKKAGK